MKRHQVVQRVIDRLGALAYLEIGVLDGNLFFAVRARHKIAVDPAFRFRRRHRIRASIRNPTNLFAHYFETTSDAFFANDAPILSRWGVDVAFVDGLHTYEQALRDIESSLRFLNPLGVILVHDCSPTTPAMAHPAESLTHAAGLGLTGWTGEWCGDVWKAVVHLRARRHDLQVFTLDTDYGIGIVAKGSQEEPLAVDLAELQDAEYGWLAANREHLLALRPVSWLETFLNSRLRRSA